LVDEKATVVVVDGPSEENTALQYVASLSIGGMTCASCTSAITKGLGNLNFVESADVNLMTNNARVVFHAPKNNSDKLVEEIEDLGYDAAIQDVRPLIEKIPVAETGVEDYKVTLSIGGMTCGSCVGSITRGLQELAFVKRSTSISLATEA